MTGSIMDRLGDVRHALACGAMDAGVSEDVRLDLEEAMLTIDSIAEEIVGSEGMP